MIRRRGAARGLAARLGLFAVLFQAVLFGWHHHDPTFAGRLTAPVVANPIAPPQAVDDEDGCDICQVLHHLTAAPVDAAGAPPPLAVATSIAAHDTAFAVRTRALSFRARAPPLA
ncbi:MAG TPA: hypothetical protein VG308_08275 [Stellaceae bacterium]|jgi:hypothetical protein|nr:hypothetical protein [Stellaceae bacterium]